MHFKPFLIVFLPVFIGFLFARPGYSQNQLIDSLKRRLEITKDTDTLRVKLLVKLGQAHWNLKPDTAMAFFRKALLTAKGMSYKRGIADALNGIGSMLSFWAEYDSAIGVFNKVIATAKQHGDINNLAMAYGNLGNVYNYRGDFIKALDYYLKSREAMRQGKNDNRQLAFTDFNIARIYADQGDPELAKQNYLRAIKVFRSSHLPTILSSAAHGLAGIYLDQDSVDKALDYLKEALEVAGKINDSRNIAAALTQMGEAGMKTGNYAGALNNYKEALELFEQLDDPLGLANVYLGLAEINRREKNYETASAYAKKSLAIAQENDYLPEYTEALHALYRAYEALGDPGKALEYAGQYILAKDSLINAEQTRKLAIMESGYELKNKKREIALLENETRIAEVREKLLLIVAALLVAIVFSIWYQYYQRNRYAKALDKKNKLLSETMASKEKLFGIIAHDLKSPLSAFTAMSSLLAENINAFRTDQIVAMLKKFKKSSLNLSELLNNLLEWSLAQTGELAVYTEKLDIRLLMENAVKPLTDWADSKGIRLSVTGDHIIAEADAKMAETVFRNVVSNALKFTDSGGEINISTVREGDHVLIAIEDTGIGMEEEEVSRLFDIGYDASRIGDHEAKGTGLGLILSKELMEKNRGTIRAESKKGKGSTFYLTLPGAA